MVHVMKKLNKLQINSDRLMKNEELMTISGGYGSYACWSEGWIPGCMGHIITYINTASCDMCISICGALGGSCCAGYDCT